MKNTQNWASEAFQRLSRQQTQNSIASIINGAACYDNTFEGDTDYRHDHELEKRRVDAKNSKAAASKNKVSKYDEDAADSTAKLLRDCKRYKKVTAAAIKGKAQSKELKTTASALLGRGGYYGKQLMAADPKGIYKLGKYAIDECVTLHRRTIHDKDFFVGFGTLVSDEFTYGIDGAIDELRKVIDKTQKGFRNYSSLSAVGRTECSAVYNFNGEEDGIRYSRHIHLLVFGYDRDGVREITQRARGFKSSLTPKPILIKPIQPYEGSFTATGRYVFKPSLTAKKVNWEEHALGNACLEKVTRPRQEVKIRTFEGLAKVPLEQTIFGVYEGKVIRDRIVRRLRGWHKGRVGTEIDLSERIDPYFDHLLANKSCMAGYVPLRVKYQRNQQFP